ncbi:hypothetical protein ACH6CV_03730 [Bacillota bacterium Meth-B3]
MEQAVVHYKCPSCSAPLAYDGVSAKLACKSCGNEFEAEAVRQADEVLRAAEQQPAAEWARAGDGAWPAGEAGQLRSYGCPSCGAQIVVDETTAATECVYCGNNAIMPEQLSGAFRPDAVLPFVKRKEDAVAAYKAHIAGKPLLPKAFASKNRMEKITGVYVPFWLFDCEAEGDVAYRAERVHTHTSGDERVTVTEHYLVQRGGALGLTGVPVDGSSKFDDVLMESIEPFDYDREVAFSTAYLPGYQAERYDVDAQAAEPRAERRIADSVADAFRDTVVGYHSVTTQSSSIRLGYGKVRNVLLPVWMLNTQWRGKTRTFAMNGQTGKLVGNLPISGARAFKWGLSVLLGSTIGLFALAFALASMGVL